MNAILSAIAAHADQPTETIAITDSHGSISYQGLWQAVNATASALKSTGYRHIALAANNGIPWAIADLACMMADAMLVPIPPFFTRAQVDHVLAEADVGLVLTDAHHKSTWQTDDRFTALAICDGLHGFQRQVNPHSAAAGGGGGGGGKITFTSGSTGTPKGVVLSNASIAATSAAIVSRLESLSPKQHLSVLPLSTLLENIAGLYAPLINGSECHLHDDEQIGLSSAGLDIEKFCALLNDSTADTMILVPQLLTAVVTLVELGMLELGTFKLLAVGGGRVARQLVERASELQLPVCEGYGLSECCSVLTLNLPGDQRPGSVGKPLSHASISVSNDGEIMVSQPTMLGYLNDDASRQTCYPTGDLGHFDEDGFLYIDGRKRNVFITAYGRNVNPEWPEAELLQHPAIAHALVVGEAREHNLGLLWLRFPQSAADIARIVASANAELPEYAQIHRWLPIDELLPDALQTSNGRLRRALAIDHYAHLINSHYAEPAITIAANQR